MPFSMGIRIERLYTVFVTGIYCFKKGYMLHFLKGMYFLRDYILHFVKRYVIFSVGICHFFNRLTAFGRGIYCILKRYTHATSFQAKVQMLVFFYAKKLEVYTAF